MTAERTVSSLKQSIDLLDQELWFLVYRYNEVRIAMRALLSNTIGGPETLVLKEVPDPQPGPNQLLLSVKACAINFPDTLIIEDRYQFKPERPFSPGGEVAGIVSAIGSGITKYKLGDRVIGWLNWGGMAEKVVVDETQCIPMPMGMPFDEASAFILTFGTSYYALKERGHLAPGETLFILGAAGGVGLAAVELGKAMGARVVAAASSEEKIKIAKDSIVDFEKLFWDPVKELGL